MIACLLYIFLDSIQRVNQVTHIYFGSHQILRNPVRYHLHTIILNWQVFAGSMALKIEYLHLHIQTVY